ncbi:MAG: hypothetical protein ACOYB1_14130 [Limnohabitans sp.]
MTTSKTTTRNPHASAQAEIQAPTRKATPVSKQRITKSAAKKVTAPTQTPARVKLTPSSPATDKTQSAKSKVVKEKKVKVVRDSFTIPKTEFTQIAEMKKRAMMLGVEVKKSELIRAGLQLISGLPDTAFKKALAGVPTLKTGRPAKD